MKGSNKRKKYTIDMCSGPLFGKLLIFAVPLMFSSILQLLFNAADIVVVGNFAGSESLAAVGSTSSLINLITNLFMGLSVGANVVAAHFLGSKQEDRVGQTVHTAVLVSLASGAFLAVFGIFAAPVLLQWMSSPEDVIGLASLYLRIYFIGMPAVMAYNFGSAILRAAGDTKRPLYYLSFSGLVNVILNLIFVVEFHMGVAGVAIATIVSQYISAALVLRCMIKEEGCLRLELKRLSIDKDIFVRMLKIGLPAGLQGTVFSLSNVVIQSSINSFGSVVMAGSAAAANLEGFVYVSMNAFYQTAITFISQNFGAGKAKRVNKVLLLCQAMVFAVGLLMGNLIILFGGSLLGFYSSDAVVIEAGMRRLVYICGPYFLCGMMDVMVGALRGIGYSVAPMIVSLLGACGLRLLWIATVFKEYHTEHALYISYPITWAVTLLVHVICFALLWKKLRRRLSFAE